MPRVVLDQSLGSDPRNIEHYPVTSIDTLLDQFNLELQEA